MFQIPNVLSEEAVDRLISKGGNLFEQAVPMVLYSSGALLTELVRFRLLDIEWRIPGTRSGYVRYYPETNPARVALLNSKTLELLRSYIAEKPPKGPWLFEKEDGSPYEAGEILVLLNRLAERAKLGEIGPTDLRDAMYTHCLERGGDPAALDQILGPVPLGDAAQYACRKRVRDQYYHPPLAKKAGQ